MYQKAVVVLMLTLLVTSFPALSCQKESYTIGIEALDYSPHYNGDDLSEPTFFKDFILWLSAKTNCQFEIIPLPIKRLTGELDRNKLDFIYPGNPNWHPENSEKRQQ